MYNNATMYHTNEGRIECNMNRFWNKNNPLIKSRGDKIYTHTYDNY